MKTRTFQEFVKALVLGLNKSKLPYAATGALAASYYGTPRTTTDVDFILQLSSRDYDGLLEILEGLGLKVDRTRIKRQLRAGYNILTLQDKNSPHQADFIIHTKGKLEKRAGSLLGLRTYYQTPESLILAKLRMVKATRPRERSLKDREDIKAIVHNTRVNLASIVRTAREETTLDVWEALLINERVRKKAHK